MQYINVATEYSRTPGARYESEGEFSGERFRKDILIPKLESMDIKTSKPFTELLTINLDGSAGYGSGWLEEVFGGLIRDGFDWIHLQRVLLIVSKEEPYLVEEIWDYIDDANDNR